MKINEDDINHNAMQLIGALTETRYEFCNITDTEKSEKENSNYLMMTLGEIAGIVEMAKAMKEILKV